MGNFARVRRRKLNIRKVFVISLIVVLDISLVLTAISPNVVVDIVLWLKTENIGMYKGIHTIIVAVTVCNDVLAIFIFGVILSGVASSGMKINPRIYLI